MTDREKVIKGLELCEIGSGDKCYETECPYYGHECTEGLKNDILELLKEQEPVRPERKGTGVTWWYACGNCRAAINPSDKYCHKCGRAVKWDDNE